MIAEMLRKAALPVLAGGALLVTGLFLVWLILVKYDDMLERAVKSAIDGRDAFWTAEIEKANAETNRRLADQATAVLAIEAGANARVRAVEVQLVSLEKANATLPNGDGCGLGRDRVRVLPN